MRFVQRCTLQPIGFAQGLGPQPIGLVVADEFVFHNVVLHLAIEIDRDVSRVASDVGILNTQTNTVPGLAPEENSPAEHLALHLAEANGTHAVSYCAEAGLFQQIGIPAIICGPGSIEQAHKPDEYIDISEMRKCEAFMARLLAHCR